MRPESLKLKVQELSTADLKQEHDEARRIVLTERIEAVQGDLADFFKKIIPLNAVFADIEYFQIVSKKVRKYCVHSEYFGKKH